MALSYSQLFNKLQYGVYDHDIPNFQASIDAISDTNLLATLKQIRDQKINQENNAITYKYYDNPRAKRECDRCIRVLRTLDFKINTPEDKGFLHQDDISTVYGGNINTHLVTFPMSGKIM